MKITYRHGTKWQAHGETRLYTIEYDKTKSIVSCFVISITGKNGEYLGAHDHYMNYASYFTLRGSIKYCRTIYGEEKIIFKRKNP